MKMLRHKSLMGLLYAVLLAVPLVSIISRVIYVQSNKNAYQSYAGTTEYINNVVESYDYQTNEVNSTDDLITDNIYKFNRLDEIWTISNDTNFLSMAYIKSVDVLYLDTEAITDILSGDTYYLITEDGNDYISSFQWNYYFIFTNDFYFVLDEVINVNAVNTLIQQGYITASDYLGNLSIDIEYTEISTLDNVFEYSVDAIIQENNFGKVDFLSWFANMFLDNTNQVNNRYLGFANWYMNYIMFVSCAYLLFLVLMWFINFARRLLDRGMNYDW